jgi:hypothetical protein
MLNEVRGFVRIIDEKTSTVTPVSVVIPTGSEAGLYVRIVGPTSIKGVDVSPVAQNITASDPNSLVTPFANGQQNITGIPATGSTASFAFNGYTTIQVEVLPAGLIQWVGTLQTEVSMDNGANWYLAKVIQTNVPGSQYSFTNNFLGTVNVSGATNFRVRAVGEAFTGTAAVQIVETINQTDDIFVMGQSIPADNTPNPTDAIGTQAFMMGWNQHTSYWDKLRVSRNGGLNTTNVDNVFTLQRVVAELMLTNYILGEAFGIKDDLNSLRQVALLGSTDKTGWNPRDTDLDMLNDSIVFQDYSEN